LDANCLVAAQVIETDERHHYLIKPNFDAVSVAIIERDTIDRREKINPQRRKARLHDSIRLAAPGVGTGSTYGTEVSLGSHLIVTASHAARQQSTMDR
jgi:hypothetical protein